MSTWLLDGTAVSLATPIGSSAVLDGAAAGRNNGLCPGVPTVLRRDGTTAFVSTSSGSSAFVFDAAAAGQDSGLCLNVQWLIGFLFGDAAGRGKLGFQWRVGCRFDGVPGRGHLGFQWRVEGKTGRSGLRDESQNEAFKLFKATAGLVLTTEWGPGRRSFPTGFQLRRPWFRRGFVGFPVGCRSSSWRARGRSHVGM